jgi:hypothetical protein
VLSKPITPKSMNVLGHGLALPLNRQSLDLATGPLINFGGASAAYSLRDLNGRNPRIVRVRRASDNHERDFYKDGINSGELTNWVNSQIVPPLDIGVETSEGRIPVPEGGTSIGIPAAAYSLRNLSTTYTGNVVDVRRSSGGTESFTAAEVADGTLEAWVNTNFNVKTYDFSSGSGGLGDLSNLTLDGGESIAGVDDALKMSVVSTGNTTVHRCYQNLSALGSGSSLRITFKAYRPSSNVNSGKLGFSFASGFLSSNIEEQFFSADDTWEDFTFDANSGTSTRFYVQLSSTDGIGSLKSIFNGTTGDHVYIKDLKIDVVNSSGFVSQWYDQSGNDNHATQGTPASQPKIVDGGTLVAGGLDFDGVDDFMDTGYSSGNASSQSLFTVFKADLVDSNFRTHLDGRDANDDGIGFGINSDFGSRFHVDTADTVTTANTAEELLTGIYGSSSSSIYQKGTLAASGSAPSSISGTSVNYFIGKSPAGGFPFNGTIEEIIIYPSDQSDNRTAIEANIGETYGITGIPAYDNTVDGFVETWYDQSGNGKDLINPTTTQQRKIVDTGVLVTEGGEPAIAGNAFPYFFSSSVSVSDSFSVLYLANFPAVSTGILGGDTNASRIRVQGETLEVVDVSSTEVNFTNLDNPPTSHTFDGSRVLLGLYRNSSSLTATLAGQTVAASPLTLSGGFTWTKAFAYGGGAGGGLQPMNSKFQELIIWNSDIR